MAAHRNDQRMCFLASPSRICNGRTDAAELQGADSYPGTRFPPGPQWERHGGHSSDWLWQDFIGEMHTFPLLWYLQKYIHNIVVNCIEATSTDSSLFFFFSISFLQLCTSIISPTWSVEMDPLCVKGYNEYSALRYQTLH